MILKYNSTTLNITPDNIVFRLNDQREMQVPAGKTALMFFFSDTVPTVQINVDNIASSYDIYATTKPIDNHDATAIKEDENYTLDALLVRNEKEDTDDWSGSNGIFFTPYKSRAVIVKNNSSETLRIYLSD